MTKTQIEQRFLRCQHMLKSCEPHLQQMDELSQDQMRGIILLLNNWRKRNSQITTRK